MPSMLFSFVYHCKEVESSYKDGLLSITIGTLAFPPFYLRLARIAC